MPWLVWRRLETPRTPMSRKILLAVLALAAPFALSSAAAAAQGTAATAVLALERTDLQCISLLLFRGPTRPASLATAFTRGFPQAASGDPLWRDAPFGAAGEADVALRMARPERGELFARKLATTAPLSDLIEDEFLPGRDKVDDSELLGFARQHGATIFHPAGTCRMGPDGAPGGRDVVDARLRVHGVAGLRVVDASVMPSVVGGNTNAPVIMMAEKAVDMIRHDRSLTSPHQDHQDDSRACRHPHRPPEELRL